MTSPSKKKSNSLQAAEAPASKNLLLMDISACGDNVASFLTFSERGRLLLVNHQLNNQTWGIVKEKTYGPSGMSPVKAARLILRVACSEFGPDRLTESLSNDAVSALMRNDDHNNDYDTICEDIEGWEELEKCWCQNSNCYDVNSIVCGLEDFIDEEEEKEKMKIFFQKVNELLSKLKASCDYLEELELKAMKPNLYEYLIEDAGIEQAWLGRFGEIRLATWGKAHFHDEEPLSYTTRRRDGTLCIHEIDQLFPGQDTIRALPSKSYKPKPIHLRKCITCHNVKSDISYFECPYKWCEEDHKGKCSGCAPTSKCASCGKSGCNCCFVPCAFEGCPSMLCKCTDFYGWKDSDRGGAPGCSYLEPRRNDDDDDDEESESMGDDKDEYCAVHKPDGAVKNETAVCVIM